MTDYQTRSSEPNDTESLHQDDDSRHQWVVGESFQHASVQPDFTTASQLRDRLRRRPPDQDNPLRIRPGLGVDDTEWSDLTSELLKAYGAAVLPEGRPPTAVPRHSVLKHSRDNVLIGDAHVEGDAFQAQLAVVNDTEMLRDHTADQQHVPGMLLIEASIQLVTWAVSEIWLPPTGHPPYYAVMHASAFEFSRFVFPLPTLLTGTFTRTGPAEDDKIPLSAEVRVRQAGQDCSRVRIDLHAFRPALVFAIEDGQARRTLLRAAPRRMTADQAATDTAQLLRRLVHGDTRPDADALDGLLDTPPFKRSAPPCGPERHARTYDRLRALGEWVGGANALQRDPARLLAVLEWSATVDPPLFLAGTVQYAVCVAAMTELGRPGPYLDPLIGEVDRHETFGSIMITEIGRGNSHLATRTEARFDPATREFTLRTPDPTAAKFMSHVAGTGRSHMAIVYARLLLAGQECGVFPFAVRVRDADRIADGIHITELPETTSVPLNYALVTFDNTRVPYDGWLRDDASIAPDGEFSDPLGDPDRRLVRSLSVSSNASTGAAAALTAAARAAVTIGIRHSQHRLTMGRLGTDLPVLNYRTQQDALYGALAEVYACGFLVARIKAQYVRQRRAPTDLSAARRPVWAPWASVSREQALTKVAATRILRNAAGVSRERAGAQGLLTVNRLLEYEGLALVYQAAAGDNLLIRLDAGKQLVEDLTHTVPVPPAVGELVSPAGALALALLRERGLLTELRGCVEGLPVEEKTAFETWNPLLPDLVTLADAHQQRLLLEAFAAAVAEAESTRTGTDPAPHLPALHALHALYAMTSLEQTLSWHLENGSLTPSDARRVHRERDRALDAVHPHLAVLLDGCAPPDARLRAPMAEQDVVAALFASGGPTT